jgi:hypothetical protein
MQGGREACEGVMEAERGIEEEKVCEKESKRRERYVWSDTYCPL